MYKDANHKPEMAVALSHFEALCSFASHEELAAALGGVPELRQLVGDDAAAAYLASERGEARRSALRATFTALMTAPATGVAAACRAMCARLAAKARSSKGGDGSSTDSGSDCGEGLSPKERLVLRLQEQARVAKSGRH